MVKQSFGRTVRLKGCSKDLGLGVGILYKDEITVTGSSEYTLAASLVYNEVELMESLIEVETREIGGVEAAHEGDWPPAREDITCFTCPDNETCEFAWEPCNTGGDCLATK